MAAYWYAFLIPGVLLLIAAFGVQLLNMRNLLKGGSNIASGLGGFGTKPNEYTAAISNIGGKVGRGFFLVVVLSVVGSILTLIGLITLVVYLLK